VKKVYFIKLVNKEIKSYVTVVGFGDVKIGIKVANMFKKLENN
jgi:hypothetical protein